jgi:hypothetical protein
MESGHLTISSGVYSGTTHSTAIPAMNVLFAFLSSVVGVAPEYCAQIAIAIVAVITITGIYLLSWYISGSMRAAVTSGLLALMFGTFVFTTGSVWKEALGLAMLVVVLVSFIRRADMRFRALCFLILMVLPIVHHLVVVIALLALAFPLTWSWFMALKTASVRIRHIMDLLTLAIPGVWAIVYYSVVSLDRLRSFSSPVEAATLLIAFSLLLIMAILVLSVKSHSNWSYAPLPGVAVFVALVLDYYGFVFDYKPSASPVYFLAALAFSYCLSIGWYGAEIITERRPVYRSIQLGLLFSPLTIVGYGFLDGLSLGSHQVVYRTFDFVDLFIFVGCGVAVAFVYKRRKRLYPLFASVLVVLAVISFPFGYYSGQLIGIRHDTQSYEIDAFDWLSSSNAGGDLYVRTDERLSFIAVSLYDIPKDATLPELLTENVSIPPSSFCVYEAIWVSFGVNDYPNGLVEISGEYMSKLLFVDNVHYIGGRGNDQIVVFTATAVGQTYNNWIPWVP